MTSEKANFIASSLREQAKDVCRAGRRRGPHGLSTILDTPHRKNAHNVADVAGCSAADRAWVITHWLSARTAVFAAVNDEEISDRIVAVCCRAAEEM